jgi:hypothetical protein
MDIVLVCDVGSNWGRPAMASLPNGDVAIFDLRKLEEYCLDPSHPRGRHKARVFRVALGIGKRDAAWLRRELLNSLTEGDALELPSDQFGRRWRVDTLVKRQDRNVVVRTLWLMRTGENAPRFVTCWVL